MTTLSVDELFLQIQRLPADQRQELMDRVLLDHDPFPPMSEPEFKRMLERRHAEMLADPSKGIPLEEVRARIEAKLGKRYEDRAE